MCQPFIFVFNEGISNLVVPFKSLIFLERAIRILFLLPMLAFAHIGLLALLLLNFLDLLIAFGLITALYRLLPVVAFLIMARLIGT